MIVIIERCFHWIGFHMITYFLEEGKSVVGIDPMETEEKECLYLYVGRNSNFQHFTTLDVKEKHIHGGEEDVRITYDQHSMRIYRGDEIEPFVFPLPPLYGEWMKGSSFQDYREFATWVREHEAIDVQSFLSQIHHYICTNQWEDSHKDDHRIDEARLKEVYRAFRSRLVRS